ncbi:hypothetical protein [Deinococcus wulumuqiensis]|uniref:Uncharacterized protein n=1 Tax=Deinococcus wulumuqiensis TaxID=980427 RepID=A0AAV4K2C0_9DEIO|nr:hypothetical protein [Deinococcus wulumuqiensis]QII20166.1 hypothetical protein G6R31_04835 [Deinococcus wulumuqiensis R12]GGI75506.1 hypothetical protein GCM10010914_07190 [Deinococcus wulumuqiensis]GGP28735.1 hypothetical protein GCM10008021_03860 [Deinococcus wulumuqiensis]
MQQQLLTALLALGTSTRTDGTVTAADLSPWLAKHAPALKAKAQQLRDGATWGEVTSLIDTTVKAAQELKPLLTGKPRARIVLTIVQTLVREYAPPSAAWLTMLLDSAFAEQLVEMGFRRLFPAG